MQKSCNFFQDVTDGGLEATKQGVKMMRENNQIPLSYLKNTTNIMENFFANLVDGH